MAIDTPTIAPPFIEILFTTEDTAHGNINADDAGGIVHETED